MTASSSPRDNILCDGIKITANCSRHVLFTAARRRGRKDGRRKAFGSICGQRLCLCPPLRGVLSCIICVLSSAQTSLEGGRIRGEKAPAATEYYAIYWVSSYGDKVDFNLGVCGGKSCWTQHIFIEKSQQIIGVKVTQSNFPSSNFYPHSEIRFIPPLLHALGLIYSFRIFYWVKGEKYRYYYIWYLAETLLQRSNIMSEWQNS